MRMPTYDEFQVAPQVAPAARAEASVTPQMMSVSGEQMQQVGRGMQGVGNAASQVVLDVQKDINEANTREADNVLAGDANRIVSNFLNQSGKDAVVNQDAVQKAIVEAASNAGQGLQNDMQRRMYHDVASRRLQQTIGQVTMHAATQAKQWNIKETEARSINASNAASSSWMYWKDDYADLRHPDADPEQFGTRPDGSKKGTGFLGVLKGANGSAMTEFSVGVKIDGKEMDVPTLVPTLSRAEVKTVLNLKDGEKLPEAIVQKAVDHAKDRIAQGKSVFAEDGEGPNQQSTKYTQDKNTMISEVNSLVKLTMGADPDSEVAKAARLNATTGMHANAISNMIVANQSRMATDYFERALGSGEIDPQKAKPLHDMVRSANVGDEAVRLTRTLTGGFDSRMKQLEQMHDKGQISYEVFREARGEVEHKWTVQKAQDAEYQKTIIGKATDWAIHNPNASILDFQKTNPVVYTYMMNNGTLADLDRVIKSGGKVNNDAAVWADVMTNMQDLKAMTPTEIYNKYSLKLDEAHLEKLYGINSALNGSKDEQHLSIMSNTEMVSNSAKTLGILPQTGKPSDKQDAQFQQFQSAVDARVAAYEAGELGGKRKASQSELKKILQEVEMDKVYKSEWGRDPQKSVVSMKPEDMKDAYVVVNEVNAQTRRAQQIEVPVAAVPPDVRAAIIGKLHKRKMPVSEQAIVQLWVSGGRPISAKNIQQAEE